MRDRDALEHLARAVGAVVEAHEDVAVGQAVEAGDVLARVEAMKLETTLRAGVAGTVTEVHATAGAPASAGTVLVRVDPTGEAS